MAAKAILASLMDAPTTNLQLHSTVHANTASPHPATSRADDNSAVSLLPCHCCAAVVAAVENDQQTTGMLMGGNNK